MGVLQCHLSGGEPLLRRDLVELVRTAAELGMYTNLVTSAIGLSRGRGARSCARPGSTTSRSACRPTSPPPPTGSPASRRSSASSRRPRVVKELGWPLTVNVVLHRQNIDRVADDPRAWPRSCDADRRRAGQHPVLRLGVAQPGRAAAEPGAARSAPRRSSRAARERLAGRMEVVYVLPDYYSDYPKPCMGGWAARQLTVAPNGDALPCPAAQTLPLPRTSVRARRRWQRIWDESPLFNGVPRHRLDAGPLPHLRPPRARLRRVPLPGVPAHRRRARTDPVCHLSPDHALVIDAVDVANEAQRPEHGAGPPAAPVLSGTATHAGHRWRQVACPGPGGPSRPDVRVP